MNSRIRLTLLMGLTLFLPACDVSKPDPDLIAVQKYARQGDSTECPWLDGHYEWIAGNPASRVFSQNPDATRQMPLFELKQNPHSATYPWRMTQRESAFDSVAEQLQAMDPARFTQWRKLMQTWREQQKNQQNTDVVMSDIESLGPVVERRGVLSANQCNKGWALMHYGTEQRIADNFESDPNHRYETEIWLGKNAKGDLLYRSDRYRLRDIGIGWGGQSINIRTSRTQSVGKAALAIASSDLNWQPKSKWFSASSSIASESSNRTDWAKLLVDLSQTILNRLPEGAEMTVFKPQTDAPNISNLSELKIILGGKARNNTQVHDILRMLQAINRVTSVELTSVRANASGQFEFETVLTLMP